MTSPTSSQSFWNEAIALDNGTSLGPQGDLSLAQAASKRDRADSPISSPVLAKRARFAGKSAQEPHDEFTSSSPFNVTESSFLPSHLGDLATSHAYLQGAEYAPNSFGDMKDYLRKKDIKIQTQNAQIASEGTTQPQIFAGLSFWINGNTTPSMEVLRRMILQRGGVVLPKLLNKGSVDYVIAPVLTLKKFNDLEKGGRLRIVREAWVVESVAEGRLLDWKKWRLRVEGGVGAMEGFLGKSSQAVGTPVGMVSTREFDTHATMSTDETPVVPLTTPLAAPQSLLRPVKVLSTVPSTASNNASDSKPSATATVLHSPRLPAPKSSPVRPTILDSEKTIEENTIAESEPSKEALSSKTGKSPQDPKTPHSRPEGTHAKYYSYASNRDAARMMQNEEFRTNRTSESGASFINEFYQNSRLHYLSTWKAELRLIVAEARSTASQAPTVLAPEGTKKTIFHVDFDAFFVSAGLATRQHLKGRPVVVCHSAKGGQDSTSEIASASYEARAKGVKNGMSLGQARKLCGDDLTTIPYEFETYKKFSLQFYTVLGGYADNLEAVSIDEALLDVTGVVTARSLAPPEAGVAGTDPAVHVANQIRDDIRAATGCEVSIGIAHNILLAKLGTRRAKPAGVFHLTAEAAPELLAGLEANSLPGVGYSMKQKLATAFGTTNCGALLAQSRDSLRKTLGPKTGDTLYGYLRGVDSRRLEPDKERKSVSAEINYAIRFQSQDAADSYLMDLATEVARRLADIGAAGQHVTLKIMTRHPDAPLEPPKFLGHGKCETVNKSTLLSHHADDGKVIGRECVKLLASMRLDPTELRGVGIQVTKLRFGDQQPTTGQTTLSFAKPPAAQNRSAHEADRQEGTVRSEQPAVVSPPPSGSPSDAVEAQSSGHIDPDFLAALPPDLRREVMAEHEAERSRRREASHEKSVPPIGASDTHTNTSSTLNPAAHITKQLRPKLKTQLKAGEIAELPLYNAWARADDSRSRSASLAPVEDSPVPESPIGGFAPSELRELGIDIGVFGVLPPEVQKESVATERARRARTVTFRQPSRRRETTPSLPAPLANRVSRPALFGARDTGDVAAVLAQWVASRAAPAEADVKRVSGYLCKCVVGGLGGVEHVSALLRGMRGLLGDSSEEMAEWWKALERLKGAVDAVLVQRMGAGLRL